MSRSCQSATFSSAAIALARIEPRQAGDLLAADRVALVRHRRRALLARGRTAPRPRRSRSSAGRESRARTSRATPRTIASAVISSAWRSRWMTCDDTGAAASPSRRHTAVLDRRIEVREHADGAGDLADRHRPRARARTRARSRATSAYQSASFTPNVIGSACTPCVRPIIGVRRCSSARRRMAAEQRVEVRRESDRTPRASAARAPCRARRTTSGRSAASAPPGRRCSATAVVNAMTSCCVVCSISSMRAMSNAARCAQRRARLRRARRPRRPARRSRPARPRATSRTGARRSRWRPSPGACSAESSASDPAASLGRQRRAGFGPTTVATRPPSRNRSVATRCTSSAVTASMLCSISSSVKWRPKYSSCRARCDMRLDVLSRLSIRLPFR